MHGFWGSHHGSLLCVWSGTTLRSVTGRESLKDTRSPTFQNPVLWLCKSESLGHSGWWEDFGDCSQSSLHSVKAAWPAAYWAGPQQTLTGLVESGAFPEMFWKPGILHAQL